MKKNILIVIAFALVIIPTILWIFGYILSVGFNHAFILLPISIILFISGARPIKKQSKLLIVIYVVSICFVSLLYIDSRLGGRVKIKEFNLIQSSTIDGRTNITKYCEPFTLYSASRSGLTLFSTNSTEYLDTPIPFIKTRNGVSEYIASKEICTESN